MPLFPLFVFFFFNDTATTEIYTLSLHDALPICGQAVAAHPIWQRHMQQIGSRIRSEEHTSELQSPGDLVCRLLLEKKKMTEQINALRSVKSTIEKKKRKNRKM